MSLLPTLPGPAGSPEVHFSRNYHKADVAAQVRRGKWVRVQTGAYIDNPTGLPRYAQQHKFALARMIATAGLMRSFICFSHVTAALIWELPVVRIPNASHVIQRHTPSGRPSKAVHRHVLHLPTEHTTTHHGLPVTTLARTAVDCARHQDPLEALTIADAALGLGVQRSQLDQVLFDLAGLPGTSRAASILALANAGAESPGETKTRVALLRAGFPAPVTQFEVVTRLGSFRADLGWPQWKVILEYDGRTKYDAADVEAFMKEKRRHDAIVEAGYRVLRVTKEDLRDLSRFAARVARFLPRGVIGPTTFHPSST